MELTKLLLFLSYTIADAFLHSLLIINKGKLWKTAFIETSSLDNNCNYIISHSSACFFFNIKEEIAALDELRDSTISLVKESRGSIAKVLNKDQAEKFKEMNDLVGDLSAMRIFRE